MAIQNIDTTFQTVHPYGVSVCIDWLWIPGIFNLVEDIARRFDSYSVDEVILKFARNQFREFWTKKVARAVHRLITKGHITEFKLQQPGHHEGLRFALSNPSKLLFNNEFFHHYLSGPELNELDVRLDWPAESELFAICITKKVEQS